MARWIFLALAAALVLVPNRGATPASAAPAPLHVEVSDFLFDPGTVTVRTGQAVVFDFVGPSHHTVTDASGMAFYGSGSVGPGDPDPTYSVTYPAAGGYLFTCIPHPWRAGRVTVPMRVHLIEGAPSPTFRVVWAASDAAAGFVYDVQITRPGGRWDGWRTGVAAPSTSFTPHGGPGIYRFRARMRSLTDGQARWSPPDQVHLG